MAGAAGAGGPMPAGFKGTGADGIFSASPTATCGLMAMAGAAGVGGAMPAGFKGTGADGIFSASVEGGIAITGGVGGLIAGIVIGGAGGTRGPEAAGTGGGGGTKEEAARTGLADSLIIADSLLGGGGI